MAIGSPQTDKFPIGTAEIRLGALAEALKLLPSHSVGALDDATISISKTAVQKMAGFPQRQVANAVTQNSASFSGTLGEYSRRNMQVMAGEAVEAAVPDVKVSLAAAAAAAATTLTLAAGAGSKFKAGQIISIYIEGAPEKLTIARIDSISTDTLTLNANTPTLHAYPAALTRVFAAQPIGKAITKTEYFTAQLIQTQFSDGRPIAWNFWKVSNSEGMELALNPTDFATTTLTLQALEPAASEYQAGGVFEPIADFIAEYPTYMAAPGG